jgi:hypothetical protein
MKKVMVNPKNDIIMKPYKMLLQYKKKEICLKKCSNLLKQKELANEYDVSEGEPLSNWFASFYY